MSDLGLGRGGEVRRVGRAIGAEARRFVSQPIGGGGPVGRRAREAYVLGSSAPPAGWLTHLGTAVGQPVERYRRTRDPRHLDPTARGNVYGTGGVYSRTFSDLEQLLAGKNPLTTERRAERSEQAAQYEAETEGRLARQRALAQGIGGGGIQAGSEIQAINNVLAQYAAQREQLNAADRAAAQQNLLSLLMALGYFA